MGKILFCVQYYPYQYNQFKLLINQLNCDIYYKSNLDRGGADNRVLPRKLVYDLDHNEYDLEDIAKKEYDYLIYTGPYKDYIQLLAKATKYKFSIYLSHSLVGTQYDISISMPYGDRTIGVMPRSWMNFDSFEHIKYLCRMKNRSWKFVESKSNPIVAETLSYNPNIKPEPNVLGIIFGEKSPFETSKVAILDNYKRLGIEKVKIKFHPLTEKKDMELFKDHSLFEILDISTPKYDFTDSCEFLVGGASSLLIESIIRNKYFGHNQKLMKLSIKRGMDINLPTLYTYNENSNSDLSLYDDMIANPVEVIKEHVNIINYIEDNYI